MIIANRIEAILIVTDFQFFAFEFSLDLSTKEFAIDLFEKYTRALVVYPFQNFFVVDISKSKHSEIALMPRFAMAGLLHKTALMDGDSNCLIRC